MTGTLIPDEDHVVRLCGGSHIDPDTGGPSPGAFMLRNEESYLSVNWLEHFAKFTRENSLEEIRKALAGKRKVGANARLALLNVGDTATKVTALPELTVTHEPLSPPPWSDPSHSGINNIQSNDPQVVAEELCQVVLEVFKAK